MSGDRWYLTQKEAAVMLSMGVRNVRWLVAQGELETVQLGRRTWITRRSVVAHLERMT